MFQRRELEKIDNEALLWSCELKEANRALKRAERSGFRIDPNNRVPGDRSQGLFQGGGRIDESEGRPAQLDLPRSPASIVAISIQRKATHELVRQLA
jgi:hypothetical protein